MPSHEIGPTERSKHGVGGPRWRVGALSQVDDGRWYRRSAREDQLPVIAVEGHQPTGVRCRIGEYVYVARGGHPLGHRFDFHAGRAQREQSGSRKILVDQQPRCHAVVLCMTTYSSSRMNSVAKAKAARMSSRVSWG